jgi:CDP-glycerol glycerophosphotransferase (TagB/SpsB family)
VGRLQVSDRAATVFLTASTPWILRNFFHAGVVDKLLESAEVVVFTTPVLKTGLVRDGFDPKVTIVTAESRPEPFLWKVSRQLRKKLYMELRGAETEALWNKFGNRSLTQRVGGRAVAAATGVLAGRRTFRALTRADLILNRSSRFRELFTSRRPSVLFATGVNSHFEDSLLRSARTASVPVIYMPSGWDHLSTKVVLSDSYRAVLTWTDVQRDEAISTYPWLDSQNVRTVGIPQFDAYANRSAIDRGTWARRYGLDPTKKTIVYFSMPQVRHSDQHLIIEGIAEQIAAGSELPNDLQLLIKCHPFDDYSKYEGLVARFPHVRMHPTTLTPGGDPLTWLPSPGEIEAMRDSLTHADVTINIYSTVTIEAALFDKPIIHVAYDLRPLPPGRIPCAEYYNFTHFKPVVAYGASDLAYSQTQLYALIKDGLANPGKRRTQRRLLAADFCGPIDGRSGERVVEEVLSALPG